MRLISAPPKTRSTWSMKRTRFMSAVGPTWLTRCLELAAHRGKGFTEEKEENEEFSKDANNPGNGRGWKKVSRSAFYGIRQPDGTTSQTISFATIASMFESTESLDN